MSSITKNNLQKGKKPEAKTKISNYPTQNMSLGQRIKFYDKKLKDFEEEKVTHKSNINNLKLMKNSFVNISQFKLDEMSKKMKNEITRLGQEQSRHEESQINESKKIQAQIDFLTETNLTISKVLDEFLNRVVNLESSLGPPK